MIVLFTSCGNDSVAALQFLHEFGAKSVVCVYNDTGWAAEWWEERVVQFEALCERYGYGFEKTESIGMIELVKKKKAWPWNRDRFCNTHLKAIPSQEWLEANDPKKKLTCCVGIRREESKERANYPTFSMSSERHGGRKEIAPLAHVNERERNQLCERAGFDVYSGRSKECYPCINANKCDLKDLPESRIADIEKIEKELGFTKKGKPRTLFRPHRMMGATGIRDAVRWANSKRGQFKARVV